VIVVRWEVKLDNGLARKSHTSAADIRWTRSIDLSRQYAETPWSDGTTVMNAADPSALMIMVGSCTAQGDGRLVHARCFHVFFWNEQLEKVLQFGFIPGATTAQPPFSLLNGIRTLLIALAPTRNKSQAPVQPVSSNVSAFVSVGGLKRLLLQAFI
jgi:hypothetical protein